MAKNKTTRKSVPEQDLPVPQDVPPETEPVAAEITLAKELSEQTPQQPQSALAAGQEDRTRSFPIVGIGASAGGLAAFEAFFANLPTDTESGIAFVLVQHLDPDHKSILAELVRRYTRLKVYEVEDGMTIEPNCTFIIPPNRDLALLHGKFHLMEPAAPRGLRLPIDFFFRSLAQDLNERAICIVLTGTGTDGTLGLRAIKEAGGMAMVQSPESAGYDGMPRSAIATGLADYVLPANKMPAQLIAYVQHAFGQRPMSAAAPEVVPWLQKIFVLLRAQTGHDFSGYKQSTIRRRVERRMAVHQIEQVEHYVRYLRQSPAEIETLFQELLIGVTGFFRDPEAYEVLAERVVPRIFANQSAKAPIRVWVAGCATGEEAYSIAILLQEHADTLGKEFNVQVFATDIDHDSIEKARAGVYPVNIAADVSPERLARFFTQENGAVYRINKSIRDRLIFAEQDIIKDPPFSRLALVSCRNLLIYMEPELQKKVVPLFHYALIPGGFLVLGNSETIGEFTNLFEAVDRKWKIYRCKAGAYLSATRLELPVLPLRPETALPAAAEEPKEKRTSIRALTEKALLHDYAPTCVTVNDQGEILYIHGRSGKYLELAPGDISVNILRTVREGLRLELATAMRRAVTHKEIVRHDGLPYRTNGDTQIVNLIVKPAENTFPESDLIFIIFEDAVPAPGEESAPEAGSAVEEDGLRGPQDQRIAALERELRVKTEYLQTTIEELETANEELKSTNEELQSTNEELQSTNEELETSKEELQSINEELATVNTELQQKIDDLSLVNNDMNNLLAGTGIGTIFVDHQLRIQRFTPAAIDIVNLIQTDIGRPVGHIASNLMNYDRLVEDTKAVLDTLIPRETEVLTAMGQWYLMRIQPYRTLENVIEGAVLTFVKITEQKRLQEILSESEQRYRLLFESVTDAVIVSDLQGRVVDCNPAALRSYGYSREEFLGLKQSDIVHPDYHGLMRDWLEHVRDGTSLVYESVHRGKDKQLISVEVHVCRIEYQQEPAFLAVVRDIIGREEVKKQLSQLAAIVRDSCDAIIMQDFTGAILAWNLAAERLYGWREAEAVAQGVSLYVPSAKRDELLALMDQLNRGQPVEPFETQRLTKDGRSLTVRLTATALVDATGKPYALTTIERDLNLH
jgi:two-component system, chemotaxis family, CheB/CheR fusion protein